MKKVLFITHYPGVGGANLSMVHLIHNLMKHHEVKPMVFLPVTGPITELLDKYQIPYETHRYVSWRTQDQGMHNILQCIAMLIINTILSVRLLHKVKKYDVLYSNSSKVVLGAFLKFFSKKPLIWHLREFGTIDYPMVFLLPMNVVARVFEYADVCIAISKEIENVYRKQFSPRANYKLIYNGIELYDYNGIYEKKENDCIKICMVGGFDKSKNQEDLIRAIAKLDLNGKKIQVDFYGDCSTPYGKEMLELTSTLGVRSIISFKGYVAGINKIIPAYHIGIITSKYEAFGRVIIEYMLSNLAVVAPNTGACPELISDGQTGMIYHIGDCEELSNSIQTLIDNPDLIRELANKGKEYAISNFTAEKNANNIAYIIKTI